tara:strand:- start:538 stop:780 length:243 start_codon:yes stop_codon:yes gene_type:complete
MASETRTSTEQNEAYARAGDSVTVLTTLNAVSGSLTADQKDEIKRNYLHLEGEIAKDDLGSNDTSSWAALITAAKDKEAA